MAIALPGIKLTYSRATAILLKFGPNWTKEIVAIAFQTFARKRESVRRIPIHWDSAIAACPGGRGDRSRKRWTIDIASKCIARFEPRAVATGQQAQEAKTHDRQHDTGAVPITPISIVSADGNMAKWAVQIEELRAQTPSLADRTILLDIGYSPQAVAPTGTTAAPLI